LVVSTYALCGFSNFSSIGMQLAVLSILCPSKQKIFSKNVTSAMIAGTLGN
jgi:nucleoside permease NupC